MHFNYLFTNSKIDFETFFVEEITRLKDRY